ncbi:CgeB family protein [Gracilibacillus timonensis]|uniref:CgeB family protein n=1 Tax=Gracilibacillus timonensis TaxID=1816696 RepID=UPI000824582F|nr:glycosyltransferase [Gracilibacillus timonensis]
MEKRKILMCYGKTNFTPGRYLEEGLRAIGIHVDVFQDSIDFNQVDWRQYLAVLFVESPSKPPVRVKHINQVTIPKLFWVHHGENRLVTNRQLAAQYKPDLILMAHSLHLAKHFVVPVHFFPFAMAKDVFNNSKALMDRPTDISSVGTLDPVYYQRRKRAIARLKEQFQSTYQTSFHKRVFLDELAATYRDSKLVVNHTADHIKSLNMRLFEGVGCGALVLSDYVPKMEEIFTPDKHLVLFDNHNDLLEKADYYLNHLDEAQTIASSGYRHLLTKHTYEHRAQELLDKIEEVKEKQ